MKPRVLHVTEALGGGVATAISQYVGERSVSHSLLAMRRRDLTDRDHVDGLDNDWEEPTRGDFIRRWLAVRNDGWDVVHAHASWAGVLVRTLPPSSARLVYSPHALSSTHHQRRAVRLLATAGETLLARRTDAFAAVSSVEVLELERVARAPALVELLPHAFDAPDRILARAGRTPSVIAVGRVMFQKAPEMVAGLPRLFRELGGPALEFVWVGAGDPWREQLLRDGGWQVTGWCDHVTTLDLIAKATVLLHAALYEGMPMVVLEAMSLGTPVVAHDITCLRALEGVTRFRTVREAARALLSLLESDQRWCDRQQEELAYVRSHYGHDAQERALRTVYRVGAREVAAQGA